MTQPSLMEMKINNTPEDFAHLLQDMGNIFWWPAGNFWVITAYDVAKDILTNPNFSCDRTPFFVSRMPNLNLELIQDFFAVVSKMMVMSDYPEFTNRRRICYDGFSNQSLDKLVPLIKTTIQNQLARCKKVNQIEFVADFAKMIPSTTLAEFFSIPENEREDFYSWSNNMTQFFGGASSYTNEDGVEVNNSASKLKNYFQDLIEQRKKLPQNDFLSILIQHKDAFGLNEEEIISQAIMMLVAGQVTTTDQMCNNLYTLMCHQEVKAKLWQEPGYIDNALDELNRLDPAVTFIFRVAKEDAKVGLETIKAGDVVFISTHAVNRDPKQFDHPDECILTRTNNKQISYGYGGHYCLGAKLAKQEMRLCFLELIQNFPKLSIDINIAPVRKHHSLAFSGFERLALSF